MERVKGIEPLSKAWEAFVLPLNYTRMVRMILPARSRGCPLVALFDFPLRSLGQGLDRGPKGYRSGSLIDELGPHQFMHPIG